MRKKMLLLLCSAALLCVVSKAQAPPIRGTVKNEKGVGVASASIKIKNSNTGTQTDDAGNFTLAVAAGRTLIISAIGFATTEVKAQDNLQVLLKEQNANLT